MPVAGRLYLLFTPAACRRAPDETLQRAIDGGVDLVQWRDKGGDAAGFEQCRSVCLERSVKLIVNDDVMLAVRRRAAGAHVGQDDMPAHAARRLTFGQVLGVSTHDLAQIAAAAAAGADYVGFGPCFPTATKGYDTGLGPEAIAAAAERCDELGLPLFAIGGITPANTRILRNCGVRRVAVSGYVLEHDDPRAAAAELLAALR
jgi:thiamine-phosphate diphosphorylase